MRYAQIDNGIVTATLDNCPKDVPEGRVFVDISDRPEVDGGWEYDRIQGTFAKPQIVSAQPVMTLEILQANLALWLAPLGKLQDDMQKVMAKLGVSMDYPIPKAGEFRVEDGVGLFVRGDGEIVGRLYCGPDGPVFTPEPTFAQADDPPALRLATLAETNRVCLGKISFNRIRNDGSGKQDELAMLLASTAEDVGGMTGQFAMYTTSHGDTEPRKRLVISDAYSERSGPRRTRVLLENHHDGLAEFA